jgi:Sortase domain
VLHLHPWVQRANGRRQHILLLAAAAAVVGFACGAQPSDPPEGATPGDAAPRTASHSTTISPSAPETTAAPPTTAAAAPPVPMVDADAPDPVHIDIAAIGVSAGVIPLGLDASGALQVPSNFAQSGWWTGGPEPGERGPAVIVGHVDSRRGPAVFFHVRDLQPGALIEVQRADGSTVEFVVDRVEQHAKSSFPTRAVYDPTPAAELRLVTCGGSFDRSSGHYLDNLVVFAHRR